ncbi:formate-dependent phosphoribosylglycinamide formyltransferase [Patescibacteria group bacterium]|nr:formate-dependent phosphoribosylglycinamide formyltransferase [Patescibacteria group bacterium]
MLKIFKTKKILLLGSGELGKEVAIEAKRLGCIVIACDRYANAPAMQVATRSYVFPMLEGKNIRQVVEKEKPDFIVPEIEAIATDTLIELEKESWNVIPTAYATQTTMNRENIRRLAAEKLKLPTSPYRFAANVAELKKAADIVGFPCFIKPTMSSSGHGQSKVQNKKDLAKAWQYASDAARGNTGKVIVEGKINFDYEITLMTVRHNAGTSFCAPIGHLQVDGDYRESWQPQPMSKLALKKAQTIAKKVTDALGGRGIFGVELFIKGNKVYFSEVSPRPHDTGMVTMLTQNMSEMELHVRAILGLPIPLISCQSGASAAILSEIKTNNPSFLGITEALKAPDTAVRIFGKPIAYPHRRMAVALALGKNIKEARAKVKVMEKKIRVVK